MTSKKASKTRVLQKAQHLVISPSQHTVVQMHVDSLKLKLRDLEESSKARGQILGDVGLIAAGCAGVYATKPSDVVWLAAWYCLIALSIYRVLIAGWKFYSSYGLSVDSIVEELIAEEPQEE